jgi:Mn-dependent DtxR family transcriptional regulator
MPEQKYTSAEDLKAFLRREALRPEIGRQPHFSFRELEIFREAARHETFSETAATLGVSKAFVSETIRQLERHLGEDVHLFERDEKGIHITPAGAALVEKVDLLLSHEAAALNAVAPASGGKAKGQPGEPTQKRHVTLRQIEVFLEAAAHDNFGAAAKVLGISPASLSQTISDLQRNLGSEVRLFEHDAAGARLTHEGRLLVERGGKLLQDEAAARNAIAGLAIGAGDGAHDAPVSPRHRRNAKDVLAAVEFIEQHASPGTEVKFPATLTRELEKSLSGLGAAGETVERMGMILDLMQASVTNDDDLSAMLEPGGRASSAFRELHEASEARHAEEVRSAPRHREKRSR